MSKFKKMGTAQLLNKLEKQQGTHQDLQEIKAILVQRGQMVDAAAHADASDINLMLQRFNLDWEIHLLPLCVVDPEARTNAEFSDPVTASIPLSAIWEHAQSYYPTRMDTKQPIGRNPCKSDKPVMQNEELMELAIRLGAATSESLEWGKALWDGASVMLCLKLNGARRVGKDTVQRYIYLLDNRTSEHALTIGFGDTVLRCGNQLQHVKKTGSIKLRHTKNMRDKLESLIEAYQSVQEDAENWQLWSEAIAEIDVTEDQVYQFIWAMTGSDLKQTDPKEIKGQQGLALTLQESIADQCNAVGWNWWGVLNGVTLLTTHKREALYARKAMPSLEEDMIYGKAGKLNDQAIDVIKTMVGDSVAEV